LLLSGQHSHPPSRFNGPQTTHRWLDMDESLSSCLGEPKLEVGWFSTNQLHDPPATAVNLPTPHLSLSLSLSLTHTHKHTQEGQPIWCLEFRVKFYVDGSVTRPWSRRARYLLFMQLREDLALGRYASTAISRSLTKRGLQWYLSLIWRASSTIPRQLDCHPRCQRATGRACRTCTPRTCVTLALAVDKTALLTDPSLHALALHGQVLCGPWDAEEHAARDYLVAVGLTHSSLGDEAVLVADHHRRCRLVLGNDWPSSPKARSDKEQMHIEAKPRPTTHTAHCFAPSHTAP
jgi:hypothetical protein